MLENVQINTGVGKSFGVQAAVHYNTIKMFNKVPGVRRRRRRRELIKKEGGEES